MIRTIIVIALLVSCSPSESFKDIKSNVQIKIYKEIASSPGSKELNAIIDLQKGQDIITLPKGVFRVDSTICISEGAHIKGAGITHTILILDASFEKRRRHLMKINPVADLNALTTISDITFIGIQSPNSKQSTYGLDISEVNQARVTNCYFESFSRTALRINEVKSSLVDHCLFYNNYKGLESDDLGYAVAVYGSFEDSISSIVEDCIFIKQRHAIASNRNANYIFRNNEVYDNRRAHAVDAHGDINGNGTNSVEIYGNYFGEDHWTSHEAITIRGGRGVIYNNIMDIKGGISFWVENSSTTNYLEYPIPGQINNFYVWNNRKGDALVFPSVRNRDEEFIVEMRDYFNAVMPGYAPTIYPHPMNNGGITFTYYYSASDH